MRHITSKLSGLSFFLMCLAACGANNGNTSADQDTTSIEQGKTPTNQMKVSKQDNNKGKKAANMMTLQGQVVYQTMEGGFFSFIANDGGKYTPMQLPKEHKKHGLLVELKAQIMVDVMTTTQFGQVIKVVDVKVLDDSKVSPTPTGQQY